MLVSITLALLIPVGPQQTVVTVARLALRPTRLIPVTRLRLSKNILSVSPSQLSNKRATYILRLSLRPFVLPPRRRHRRFITPTY